MDGQTRKLPHKKVLIIGATGGIGAALLNLLCDDMTVAQVFATYHRQMPSIDSADTPIKPLANNDKIKRNDIIRKIVWLHMDVTDEVSIKSAFEQIKSQAGHLDWVINAVGLLHTQTQGPEKSLSQIDSAFFMENMRVNALPSLLIAKYAKGLLRNREKGQGNSKGSSDEAYSVNEDNDKNNPAIFATISARVGSISDNRLGGWYSYRMSKAALNMGMKTLSIEWQRSLKEVCVVAIQPGTVDTDLSKPFQSNVSEEALFQPAQCASNLINVLNELNASDTGSFVDWRGQHIDW